MINIVFRIWLRAVLLMGIAVSCCGMIGVDCYNPSIIIIALACTCLIGVGPLIVFNLIIHLFRSFMKTERMTLFVFIIDGIVASVTGILLEFLLFEGRDFYSEFKSDYSIFWGIITAAAIMCTISILTYSKSIRQLSNHPLNN